MERRLKYVPRESARNIATRVFITFFGAVISSMASSTEVSFTTRDYIQGNDAVTQLNVSNGQYTLVMRGDVTDTRMPGAGIFMGVLSPDDEERLKNSVQESKKYQGSEFTPSPLIDKLVLSLYANGEKKAKLDATVHLGPKGGKLIATVAFQNIGQDNICFSSPSTWEGTFNPILGNSWARISAILKGTEGREETQRIQTETFGGSEMSNSSEYPDEVMCIPPGQVRNATFLVFPRARIRKGTYIVGGSFVVKGIKEPKELGPSIEFFSVNQTVDFPHDYPSTSEEIKAFSAYLKSKEQE